MSRWQRGDRIGDRFRIEGKLASGGMAEIFVAKMTLARGVERRVAIKRIHPHLADDPDFLTMFLDETRVSSQLSHSGIVSVLDAIEHDRDLLMVLEYVPGWDLRAILRRLDITADRLPYPIVLQLGLELAGTLAYVHEAKDGKGTPLDIVHRDVTPSNVLVAEDGSLRLLDFGVAKAASRATRTATSSLKGKIAYAAPEQVLARPVSARTDLYALGLVLFELATGRKALEGDSALSTIELARDPKHVAPSTLRPELPAAFDALVTRLLAAEPEDRPASAREVVRELEHLSVGVEGVHRRTVRDLVRATMKTPTRPIEEERSGLESALVGVLGLDDGAATGAVPGEGGAGAPGGGTGASTRVERTPPKEPLRPASGAVGRGRRPRWVLAVAGVAAVLGVGGIGAAIRFSETVQLPSTDPAASGAEAPLGGPGGEGAAVGFLRIASEPPGARVEVDGEPWDEPTPTVVPTAAGAERRIVFRLDDHLEADRRVTALPGDTTTVRATLERLPGRLIVTSRPPGAEVRVEDEARGTTPLTLEDMPRRQLSVRVSLSGHGSHEETAPLDEVAEHTIAVRLAPRTAHGLLNVSSRPWARVRVAGRVVAESTPAIGIRLPVGTHVVVLENPQLHITQRRRVTIREGRTEQLVVQLR